MIKYLFLFVLYFGLVTVSFSQSPQKPKFEVLQLPKDSYSIFVAFHPESPLKFEKIEGRIKSKSKMPVLRYQIRNVGSKEIRSFTVDIYRSFTEGELGRFGVAESVTFGSGEEKRNEAIMLMPDQIINVFDAAEGNEQISIDELSKMLGKEKNIKQPFIIWFAKISEIAFADGSKFEDKRDLKNFFGFVNY